MTTEQAREGSISEARFMDLMRRKEWTDDEGVELTVAFVGSRGKDGATEDDIQKWFDYLTRVRLDFAITMLVAMGSLRMAWTDGEDEPRFWANENETGA